MVERTHDPDPAGIAPLHKPLANGCDSPPHDPEIQVSELRAIVCGVGAGSAERRSAVAAASAFAGQSRARRSRDSSAPSRCRRLRRCRRRCRISSGAHRRAAVTFGPRWRASRRTTRDSAVLRGGRRAPCVGGEPPACPLLERVGSSGRPQSIRWERRYRLGSGAKHFCALRSNDSSPAETGPAVTRRVSRWDRFEPGCDYVIETSARRPFPPLGLANRVCALEGRGDPLPAYEQLGAEAKAALLDLLPDGWSFDGKRVLDFGCGAGRTLRHFLLEAERAEFWGADIDDASITWLERNLSPPLHLLRNDSEPPLGLEYGTVHVAWALSVFTHLTANSVPWLVELHRLLAPGGLLIATYMGRWNAEVFTHEPWDEDRIGMNVLRRDQGWDDGGPVVLMSDWWVQAHWGRAFEILRIVPEMHGQTWVLLRKRDLDVTTEELEKPADDPREYSALRHNLRQVERDREVALAELRRHFEGSRSWRVTRPLRASAALADRLRHSLERFRSTLRRS
jgi:SAM-dependent methyltransferase